MEEQASSPINNDNASSSTSLSSQLEESEQTEVLIRHENQQQQPNNGLWRCQWQPGLAFERINTSCSTNDAWSCSVVLLIFCFFASLILILGFYGSFDLQLSPNCSFLIKANPFFVHSIQARQIDDQTDGPMLFGFHESPLLDIGTTWSRTHTVSIETAIHKEWAYYLNVGSKLDVSYDVKFPDFASMFLVIAQGRESLREWVDVPSYNSTISWNVIYGSGKITQDIKESDTYFVAVGNLNLETVTVYLNITIKSLHYDTNNASFQCSLSNRVCIFNLALLKPYAAVLTSPGQAQVKTDHDWYIQVSYGPQWVIYCCGSCIVAALIIAIFKCLVQSDDGNQVHESAGGREPLDSPKNNDHSNWGSSYDSIPSEEDQYQDHDDLKEKMILEGRKISKGENHNPATRRLCVICFDATRDSFFLPCGHCAACFSCGSRIAEEAGTCPICRRKMKKVRKIFSV